MIRNPVIHGTGAERKIRKKRATTWFNTEPRNPLILRRFAGVPATFDTSITGQAMLLSRNNSRFQKAVYRRGRHR